MDEFALRHGHSYGTPLAGAQIRRPAGILPERSADSFTARLAARPGIKVICRDGAGSCRARGDRITAYRPVADQTRQRHVAIHDLLARGRGIPAVAAELA